MEMYTLLFKVLDMLIRFFSWTYFMSLFILLPTDNKKKKGFRGGASGADQFTLVIKWSFFIYNFKAIYLKKDSEPISVYLCTLAFKNLAWKKLDF